MSELSASWRNHLAQPSLGRRAGNPRLWGGETYTGSAEIWFWDLVFFSHTVLLPPTHGCVYLKHFRKEKSKLLGHTQTKASHLTGRAHREPSGGMVAHVLCFDKGVRDSFFKLSYNLHTVKWSHVRCTVWSVLTKGLRFLACGEEQWISEEHADWLCLKGFTISWGHSDMIPQIRNVEWEV